MWGDQIYLKKQLAMLVLREIGAKQMFQSLKEDLKNYLIMFKYGRHMALVLLVENL
jgi:hypothetical protein